MTHEFSIESFFSLEKFAHRALFADCSYVWEALIQLSEYLASQQLGKIETDIPEGAHLINPKLISIGKGTIVEPGAYIKGPCIIGENCEVRHGAYIRGNVVTGTKCILGHGSEVKRSILMNGAYVAHFNYVGDSILGNGVNLGAGVKCANLRLDRQPVTVSLKGEKFATQLKKLGAIIADESQLGCNCVTNPGTLIGKKSLISPCLNIGGYIAPLSKIKSAQQNLVQTN